MPKVRAGDAPAVSRLVGRREKSEAGIPMSHQELSKRVIGFLKGWVKRNRAKRKARLQNCKNSNVARKEDGKRRAKKLRENNSGQKWACVAQGGYK